MVSVTVSIEDRVHEVLRIVAEHRGATVEDVLREMVMGTIEGIRVRTNDPIIGMIDSGQTDISERDEDILRSEWRPLGRIN